MNFKLVSPYSPTGDQPEAIRQLVDGINSGVEHQTLQGVTGSGKTFTMANVIKEVGRPTLILSHNKTLAAQLYGEFKQFFPENEVHYFVSYYDYYQPEAYLPTTGTYIEKDLSINAEIEKLRLATTSALLSGRSDIIVISSVSCIYGMGNPDDFTSSIFEIKVGQTIARNQLLRKFVDSLYSRTEIDLSRGNFKVRGDIIDVFPAYLDIAYRISFWGDEIEEIHSIDPVSGKKIERIKRLMLYPATLFVTSKERMNDAIFQIQLDMVKQVEFFKTEGKLVEAQRIQERTEYDIEMMKELGYCSGIENYSRYMDGRAPGARPFCLLDYFPDDFIMMIDESHVTVSQIKAMYGGDRSRKINLVEYGFRLPAAMDNRPLKFEEFESILHQTIYVSATPADYELEKSEGVVVEQIIRPTGLLDPLIEIRPSINQVDDLLDEIDNTVKKGARVLVTTLTKRMAEELAKYITNLNIKCRYIHSDVDTMERVEILRQLRLGDIDVLIGVNLLREGLDLPEVSLVGILDADKEGFLRSERSLTQTVGRAARNVDGKVIMYADKITESMQKTIDETNRRRGLQMAYNEKHGITPRGLNKSREDIMEQTGLLNFYKLKNVDDKEIKPAIAADPIIEYMTAPQLEKAIAQTQKSMEKAAKELDFLSAAKYRDELFAMKEKLAKKV